MKVKVEVFLKVCGGGHRKVLYPAFEGAGEKDCPLCGLKIFKVVEQKTLVFEIGEEYGKHEFLLP